MFLLTAWETKMLLKPGRIETAQGWPRKIKCISTKCANVVASVVICKHSIIFLTERHLQSFLCLRVTRCPIFNGTVPFLMEVSHCPDKNKTGWQIVPFLNSAVLLITNSDFSLWYTSSSWSLDA
jgi:hypothetical protein